MHLIHAFVAHPCMRNNGCVFCVTVKSPLSRLTPRANKIIIHVFINIHVSIIYQMLKHLVRTRNRLDFPGNSQL